MIEIVLVRHAQPDWEPGGRAVDEPHLTDLGRRQAERIAEALGKERFDGFYASPLRRARETAAPLATRLDVEPRVQSWLAELGLPSLEGSPLDEVQRYFAVARLRDLGEWWDGLPGGESFRHFQERVRGGLESLLLGPHRAQIHEDGAHRIWQVPERDQHLLIVAHQGSIAVILSELLGIEAVPWAPERFRLGWAGIARARTIPLASGAIWSLEAFNLRDHLAGLPDPES